jgi:DNA repair photolyase
MALKGRGAVGNPPPRYRRTDIESVDDGWYREEQSDSIATEVRPEPARTIISRNDSPDIMFDQSINPYRGCEHGCIYCLSGDTSILMADGSVKPLADLRTGDWIVGTRREGWYRRYVKTQVLAHWSVIKPVHRVTLEDHTELLAGPDHRFLTERGWKYVTAGRREEGKRPFLTANNKLMGMGLSAMAFDVIGQAVKSAARLQVVSVEPLGKAMRLYDITTGTEDFIANGVVSHNCYARPSHAYMDLSPGIDFETKLFYKADAAKLLTEELGKPGYVVKPITLGANTDPYQPLENRLKVTRSLLEVLERTRHPVSFVTKGSLILRDLDLLRSMAADNLVQVFISVTTLDAELKRIMEPRTASPLARLRVIRELRAAGIPTGALVAPMIPMINDRELESIIEAIAAAGASQAHYVLLRLPHELKEIFRQWLDQHFPARAEHVMSLIRSTRAGRENDPRFGARMVGSGAWADLLRDRFRLACRRFGLNQGNARALSTEHFRAPSAGGQLSLL